MPSVLVPLAPDCEEMEAVIIIDVLRRADIDVTVASCAPDRALQITASRGVRLVADCSIDDCANASYDLIALPGGMPGAKTLRDNPVLITMLKAQAAREGWLAAICAAPAVVLQWHGLLQCEQATCHPAFQRRLPREVLQARQPVVIDTRARRITSQAPGTAIAFALALVATLCGEEKAREVAGPMVADYTGA